MPTESKLVCDIRYSINYYPNSITAAEYAAETLGLRGVLLDVLYSPAADEDDEDCFLMPPPLSPEYDMLTTCPWSTWYYDYVISRQFTVPDLLDEIFSIHGIEEYWICLKTSDELYPTAVEKLADTIPDNGKAILVSESLPQVLPARLYGCDRSGKHKYRLISRPKSLSEDAVLLASEPPLIANTFSLDCHPAAEYKLISLP
jgi:hypothetical protein